MEMTNVERKQGAKEGQEKVKEGQDVVDNIVDSLLPAPANQHSPGMQSSPRRAHLYLSAFILNINYLLCGVGFAWSSPVLVKLPLTDVEGSNVASMLSLGSIPSPFIAGILLNKIGRKGIAGLSAVLVTISSLLLLFAEDSVTMLTAGRLVLGAMCGITFTTVPMYIAEISENSVRGLLNTLSQLFCCAGSLMVYVVGPFVSYSVLHYIILALSVCLLVLFPILPNSPYYLVMKGDTEGARKCLTWLREGRTASSIEKELKEIQETIQQNLATKTNLLSLFTVRGNLKALIVCTSLIVLQQLTGITLIFFYSEKIIRTAGTEMSSSTCSIVIGVFMLVSAFISPLSVKYFGYKRPLVASALGMFCGMTGLGVFFLLKSNNFEVGSIGWLPLFGIVVYILFFNSGFCNIPWAMSGELFPSDIKPAATTFIAVIGGTSAFLITNLFPELISLLGMDFLFLTCAFFCSFLLVFVMLVVHDTSGMSFAEIQVMMNDPRKKGKE